eukprot:11864771-Heterocapsa_arctica.AAC.1
MFTPSSVKKNAAFVRGGTTSWAPLSASGRREPLLPTKSSATLGVHVLRPEVEMATSRAMMWRLHVAPCSVL